MRDIFTIMLFINTFGLDTFMMITGASLLILIIVVILGWFCWK